jgi:hypothetical protein
VLALRRVPQRDLRTAICERRWTVVLESNARDYGRVVLQLGCRVSRGAVDISGRYADFRNTNSVESSNRRTQRALWRALRHGLSSIPESTGKELAGTIPKFAVSSASERSVNRQTALWITGDREGGHHSSKERLDRSRESRLGECLWYIPVCPDLIQCCLLPPLQEVASCHREMPALSVTDVAGIFPRVEKPAVNLGAGRSDSRLRSPSSRTPLHLAQ